MTKPDLTSISIVLDRSGSMQSTMNDTIGGFNAFLAEQKKQPGDAVLTLATFSDDYSLVYDAVPLKEVANLTTETYYPSGSTALLDAIARTMNATGAKLSATKEEDRPSKVLLVIITDGEENASREFKHTQVMEMIKHQQDKYSWSFVYIGANQDAIQTGHSFGISAGNSYTYDYSSKGTQALYSNISFNTSTFRGSSIGSTNNFFNKDVDTTSPTTKS